MGMIKNFRVANEPKKRSVNAAPSHADVMPRHTVEFTVDMDGVDPQEKFTADALVYDGQYITCLGRNDVIDAVLHFDEDEIEIFLLTLNRELLETVNIELKKNITSEEREFCMAILSQRSQIAFEPGGFRKKLVDAAIHADPSNRARIYKGFPDLKWPMEVLDTEVGNERIFDILGIASK